MYRYRDTTGSTTCAVKALKHLVKCGYLYKIIGYQYQARHKRSDGTWFWRVDHRIKVIGDLGQAMFNGFCYGYFGEGSRGLIALFDKIGVPTFSTDTPGYHCAYNIKRSDQQVKAGRLAIDWQLELIDSVWKITIPS